MYRYKKNVEKNRKTAVFSLRRKSCTISQEGGIKMIKKMLLDFLFVGIPETVLILIIGLILGHGTKFKQKVKYVYLKIILSTVIILSFIFFIRTNISSIVMTSIFSFCLYATTYYFILGIKIRRSIIIGAISIYLSLMTDILILPFINISSIFEHKIQFTILSRCLQLIILGIVAKWNLNLGKLKLLDTKWNKLTNLQKIDIIAVMIFPILTVVFNASYCDLVLRLPEEIFKNIKFNLNTYFFQNCLLFILNLYILNRTKKFYILEDFLIRDPEEIFKNLMDLAITDKTDIKKYKKILEDIEKEKI